VRVIKPSRIRDYAKLYPDAATSLEAWLKDAKRARWQHLFDVRRVYPHADSVRVESGGAVTVFNVGGNKYRLIAAIHYNREIIYVLMFLTHAEYDKDKWKDQL